MVPSRALMSSKMPVRSMVVHRKIPATTVTMPKPTDSRKETLKTDQASILATTSLARRALAFGAGRTRPLGPVDFPVGRLPPLVGLAACVLLTVLLRRRGQYPRMPDLGRWIHLLCRFPRFRRLLRRRLRVLRFRS